MYFQILFCLKTGISETLVQVLDLLQSPSLEKMRSTAPQEGDLNTVKIINNYLVAIY